MQPLAIMGGCFSTNHSDDDYDDGGFYNQRSSRRPEQVIATRPRIDQSVAHQSNVFVISPPTLPDQMFQTATATTRGTFDTSSTFDINHSNDHQQFRTPLVNQSSTRKNVKRKQVVVGVTQNLKRACEACGGSDHIKDDCRYRNRLCFYCREEGHTISICPVKRRDRERILKHTGKERKGMAKRRHVR